MTDVKQVKVDNWGIYFLQRLKHFFNRTDYCDLTLQFQDNAQLKVHRLVLNSCTEYFEILERTCEMYSDCLVMPDDLQADVVVPIVNFMYTGQLEFKMDLLEKLYQTSLIMNMPVLTKLLDAHRTKPNMFGKRYSRSTEPKQTPTSTPINSQPKKRTFGKAFENDVQSKKKYTTTKADILLHSNGLYSTDSSPSEKSKTALKDPKPTRYELPAELDDDNIFDNSFTSLSYESKPLMVHPETTKYYTPKKNRIFDEPSSSKRFLSKTMDIVECRKITQSDMFEDVAEGSPDDSEMLQQHNEKEKKDSSQLFDQILIKDSKVSIERKDNTETSHLDHAKIISEVLKKYPHLVKNNKNIKLKILNTPNNQKKMETKLLKAKTDVPDYTYETDVVDSQEAARLIALGAENVKGPWICLICGTPGRALHFTSYYNYRRHLVEVHNEKPVSNICEYCGLKSLKRNYLVHHLYTKHGVEPSRAFNFPKCDLCSYVALTEAFLLKHKMTHSDNRNFRCTICAATFPTSNLLLKHIQKTGHKFSGEKKPSPQCIYCYKVFTRDANLYSHLKANHYDFAKRDGVIDDSDDEKAYSKFHSDSPRDKSTTKYIAVDLPSSFESQYEETSYQLEHKPDGNIEIMTKKPRVNMTPVSKKKILNAGFIKSSSNTSQKIKILQDVVNKNEFMESPESSKKKESIVLIDNNEYILSEPYQTETEEIMPSITTRPEFSNIHHINTEPSKLTLTKSNAMNPPIQIVVSNEEEYKALLSSNHSIIFDDGASDKALTVLTGPNNSDVGDTINLNNAQSNEMVIIRENYPLNISEPNPTDNSNIVVVYSHPVNEPNKHYQLITSSQALEGQFVQSSAIFTQNYETVTTSTPVMGGHVVVNNASVDNSWQTNMPIVTSEMQIITSGAQHNTNINEIPQVEITGQAIEIPVPQQLSNIQETVITSGNSFANINNDPIVQTLTDVTPTTIQAATIIPVGAIRTISSVNEPMVVDSFQEVTNDIESQSNLIIEQQTESFEQPANSVEHQSDTIITQHPDAVIEQQPDTVVEHQAITIIGQQPDTIIREQHPHAVNEHCHTVIEHPDAIIEQLPDAFIEQPNTIIEQHQDTIIAQQPDTVIGQHTDTIIEQHSDAVIEQHPNSIIDQPSDGDIEKHDDNLLEQQTITISIQQPFAVIEQQQPAVNMEEPQQSVFPNAQQSDIMATQQLPDAKVSPHESNTIVKPPSEFTAEHKPHTIVEQQQPVATIVVSNNTNIPMEQDVQKDMPNLESNGLQIYGVQTTLTEQDVQNSVNEEMERIHTNSSDIQEQIKSRSAEIIDIIVQSEKNDEETIENIARDIGVNPNILVHRENLPHNEKKEKPIIKEIAKLTSEWSEDEGEEDSSIPNEVNNESNEDKPDISILSQDDSEAPNESQNTTAPQEKISSLLNDWEDNDSQEETISETITSIPREDIKYITDVTIKEEDTAAESQQDSETKAPKHDNISKLVSDWDEDDEEDNKVDIISLPLMKN